ncbi:MAG: hypothetical protein GY699_12040 [Desulfobacteraceae bacterium]|nr:hypothetical protein [Desulfobacteraceae bacterium]
MFIRIVTYISVLITFSGGFKIVKEQSGLPFDIYYYYGFIALMMLVFVYKYGVKLYKPLLLVLGIIIIPSALINIYQGNNTYGMVIKQICVIFIVYSFYYYILKLNNFDCEKIIRIYLNIAFYISCIGIIQIVSFLIGFKGGYDFSYFIPYWGEAYFDSGLIKMHSILPEPAHYAIAMMPAFFVGLNNIAKGSHQFISKNKSYFLVISMFFTLSLVAYFGMFVSLILLLANKRNRVKVLIITIIVSISIFYIGNKIPGIKNRVVETYRSLHFGETKGINLSTFAFYNNGYVAINNFLDHSILGTGIGSHPVIFDRYSIIYSKNNYAYNEINMGGDVSLLFRIISEMGTCGLILIIVFIGTNYVGNSSRPGMVKYGIISHAALSLFAVKLLRSGHYVDLGLPLFVLLYYYNSIKFKYYICLKKNTINRDRILGYGYK